MSSATNTAGSINRITKEVAHISKSGDLSLAVACRDEDVRQLRALIIGPPDTPYEFGFFEVRPQYQDPEQSPGTGY